MKKIEYINLILNKIDLGSIWKNLKKIIEVSNIDKKYIDNIFTLFKEIIEEKTDKKYNIKMLSIKNKLKLNLNKELKEKKEHKLEIILK